jgi:hypothetical protein
MVFRNLYSFFPRFLAQNFTMFCGNLGFRGALFGKFWSACNNLFLWLERGFSWVCCKCVEGRWYVTVKTAFIRALHAKKLRPVSIPLRSYYAIISAVHMESLNKPQPLHLFYWTSRRIGRYSCSSFGMSRVQILNHRSIILIFKRSLSHTSNTSN